MSAAKNNNKKTPATTVHGDMLGVMPALSSERGKSGPPDVREVSLRWLAGTVLTGVTSITLMGGALMAAVDRQDIFTTPDTNQEAHLSGKTQRTATLNAKTALYSAKGDRPVPSLPDIKDKEILHLSTLTRGESGNRVRTRPFARLDSSIARHVGDPSFKVPPFDPVTIFSGSSKFREKGGDEVLYDTQVEDEIEIRNAAFPFDIPEGQAIRSFSDEEVEASIRHQLPILKTSLDDGTIIARAGAIAYVDPARFESAPAKSAETPFDDLVVIRSENVLTVEKTNDVAHLETAGRSKSFSPKKKRSLSKFWEEDMGMKDGTEAIIAALSKEYGISTLAPTHNLRMSYAGGPDKHIPDVVSVYSGEDHIASIARADNDSFVSTDEPETFRERSEDDKPPAIARKQSSIYRAIYETAFKNNIPDQLTRELIRIYAFDVDFRRSTKPDDGMEVFYSLDPKQENATEESEILYTSLTLDGLKRRYYRFKTTDDSAVGYYDENGRSAKKFLMRQPVPRAKFRSPFGWRRHPILRTSRLHKGVDWSAKRGTPIFAAGNGVIEDAKWFSGYGRWIKIRHANGYKTGYAHMSRFAKGMKPGTRVRQGQVIGYVGSTGLSTGPHLHYEVIVNGRHVDPMRIRLPRGRVLSGEQLAAFERERNRIDELLRQTGHSKEQTFALNN